MRFQIDSVQADGFWVPLTDNRLTNMRDNIYTMIVGQNAVGKSRLLRKIVSNYIFADKDLEHFRPKTKEYFEFSERHPNYQLFYSNHNNNYSSHKHTDIEIPANSNVHPDIWHALYSQNELTSSYFDPDDLIEEPLSYGRGEVMPSKGSTWSPTHVIAVSTGRHDRFPNSSQFKKELASSSYSYIGTERPHGSSVPSSIASLIDGLLKGQQNTHKLSKIFDYLGFFPYLDLKLSLDMKQLKKLSELERNELYLSCHPDLIEYLAGEQEYIPFIDSHRIKFHETLRRQKRYHIELNFWGLDSGIDREILSDLVPLLKVGLVKIYDVTLIKSNEKSRLRLSQASSGQQCMLTIMLGIAGSIQNGSLICIDEPEISLHPQWQSNLVKQLQEVFSDYYGCHFIIATHSPQLVSGLATESGYVLNLEEKRLYHSYEYAKRSADFQLAEIFHSPGQNNEYLLRITLLLLTKITRREQLELEDKETIHKLLLIKNKMSDTDPVYHLIGQLEALY
ncbi:AAA family ATPase [Pseudomonas sp. HLS-6 TE3448]